MYLKKVNQICLMKYIVTLRMTGYCSPFFGFMSLAMHHLNKVILLLCFKRNVKPRWLRLNTTDNTTNTRLLGIYFSWLISTHLSESNVSWLCLLKMYQTRNIVMKKKKMMMILETFHEAYTALYLLPAREESNVGHKIK